MHRGARSNDPGAETPSTKRSGRAPAEFARDVPKKNDISRFRPSVGMNFQISADISRVFIDFGLLLE